VKRLILALTVAVFATNVLAWYQPAQGRWLSRDSIEERGGINLYQFVDNDPVNQYDPFGLQAQQAPQCVYCCANDVTIKNVRRIDDSLHWGTSFDVEVELEFPKGAAKNGSTKYEDCQLIWKEKTDLPAIPGHQPNQWTDMYGLYPQSPTFDPWRNKQIKPGQTTHVTINDPPALGKRPGRNATRTLEFEIVVKSSSGPACQKKEVSATAWQFLEMRNGQGVTEQFKVPAP